MNQTISKFHVIVSIVCIAFLLAACVNSNPTKLEFEINSDKKTCTITGMGEYDSADVVIPEKIGRYTVTAIGDDAFSGTDIERIDLPKTITKIGDRAFAQCYSLAEINLPAGLKQIGNSAFYCCSNIERIEIPNTVKELPEKLFFGCTSLRAITLNNGLITIGKDAFYLCQSLEQIVFPSTLQNIGDGAFTGCHSLTEIILPYGFLEIDYNAFSLCSNLSKIHFPASFRLVSVPFAMECPKLTAIVVDEANLGYISVDGVLYTKMMNILLSYPSGKDNVVFTVQNTVVEIFNAAFVSNRYLETVNISKNTNKIGPAIFALCHNLKSVNYEGTIAEWNSISKHADWDVDSPDFTIYCTDGTIAKDGTIMYNQNHQ
ncbi:MAG: leucine-rich repeat domain-containing protein [Eubacteriales bacterium]